MHISLDSALGQQRRLNQVGESITQIAPDPAAAYSLRSLTGGDPKVVRVRRGSDNHEQDFTASEVSSGALLNFVNAQVTAPLDIQELSATGRDGDFLIAKAAYSLRSLGTRQATVAATGDTVDRSDGKFVAQVRRNVDGNLKSFTATEVTDGTLVSFVNESFTSSLPLDVQGSAAAAYSLRNLSSSYSGNVVEVRRSSDDTTQNFTATEVTDGTLLSFVGTGGSDNGFVKTWYDQSGNSNNAVQATPGSQPKIVSAGALVVDNGIGGLDFDGDDFLVASSVSGLEGSISMFAASVRDATGYVLSPSNSSAANRYFGISEGASTSLANARNTSNKTVSDSVSGDDRLTFVVTTGATSTSVGANGSAVTTTTDDYGDDFAGSNLDQIAIGLLRTVSASGQFNGRIREILVYSSDQTDKRRAIEESIATNYGITLSSFNRDGFVKTWYDQSVTTQAGDIATGNHATQATPANQPKIVSAGSLVSGGLEFDGSNDFFSLTSSITQSGAFSYFFALDGLIDSPKTLVGTSGGATPRVRCESSNLEIKSSATEINYSTSAWTANSGKSLVSFNRNGSNSASAHRDGVEIGTAGSMSGNLTHDRLFKLDDANAANFTGKCQEVIIYSTDQTDNRTAIEANIGEAYSIDLPSGVDPGFDQVNGFVETWYDQSGNGNDAVQATAGSQPKIVNAGSLVTQGGKANIDFSSSAVLSVSSFTIANASGHYSAIFVGKRGTDVTGRGFWGIQSRDAWGLTNTAGTNEMQVSGVTATGYDTTSTNLHSQINDGTNTTIFRDGSQVATGTTDAVYTSPSTNKLLQVGSGRYDNRPINGAIQELIIYNSDQSANRSALETNIISHYGIS